jgi:Protein of unknown function (DUF4435)
MRAFTALYRPYNDIDIYVEDMTLTGLYERIFSRLLKGTAKITTVTPLGHRDAVVAEARRLKHDRSRRRFFLIDGDFCWILGPCPRARGLYMLKCYSIENFAFERVPVLETAGTLAPHRTAAHLSAAFSEDKFAGITEALLPLFVAYAMGQLLKCQCETVGFSVFRLLKGNASYELSELAIKKRIREIHSHLRQQFNWQQILGAKKRVRAALRKGDALDARFISGKSYLCGILLRWFQQEANFRGNDRQMLSLILDKSLLNLDPGLGRSLRRIARS